MKTRPVLGFAAALSAMLVPCAALADDAGDLRDSIVAGCEIKPWQFAVRIELGGAIIPQMSPTLSPDQRKCVLKMINDFRRSQAANT